MRPQRFGVPVTDLDHKRHRVSHLQVRHTFPVVPIDGLRSLVAFDGIFQFNSHFIALVDPVGHRCGSNTVVILHTNGQVQWTAHHCDQVGGRLSQLNPWRLISSDLQKITWANEFKVVVLIYPPKMVSLGCGNVRRKIECPVIRTNIQIDCFFTITEKLR